MDKAPDCEVLNVMFADRSRASARSGAAVRPPHPSHRLQDAPAPPCLLLHPHMPLSWRSFAMERQRRPSPVDIWYLTGLWREKKKTIQPPRGTFKLLRFEYHTATGNNLYFCCFVVVSVVFFFFCGWFSRRFCTCRDVGMACTRRTKTLVSTCVILSGMTNIICLLYVGWVTNYIANIYIKVPMPLPETKLEGDKRGDTLRIMERLDRLETVVNQHIQGEAELRPQSWTLGVSIWQDVCFYIAAVLYGFILKSCTKMTSIVKNEAAERVHVAKSCLKA